MQFEAFRIADAQRLQLVIDFVAADQDGDAVAKITELDGGTQHHFLFRFGEHDALRVGLRHFIGAGEDRGCRIQPAFQ